MKREAEEKDQERFEEAWRSWAQAPPRMTPARAAAAVRARLETQLPRWHWWSMSAAAAAILFVVFLGTRTLNPPGTSGLRVQDSLSMETAPLREGEVLMWLDEETPLYMTFQPPETTESTGGKS